MSTADTSPVKRRLPSTAKPPQRPPVIASLALFIHARATGVSAQGEVPFTQTPLPNIRTSASVSRTES